MKTWTIKLIVGGCFILALVVTVTRLSFAVLIKFSAFESKNIALILFFAAGKKQISIFALLAFI